jgi:hypothetical protein
MSMREAAIAALHSILMSALAARSPPPQVLRGETIPQPMPPGGIVMLRDGETVEETAILSPLAFAIEHRAEIEGGNWRRMPFLSCDLGAEQHPPVAFPSSSRRQ